VLVYASAPPSERDRATPAAARAIELAMAELARVAVRRGVRRIVVAGGETSGAVVDGLGVDRVVVAREEDRGVPWVVTAGSAPLALLLKSGNFGRPDLLVRAAETP
jgi:3-dehydrotetronate 4-kinase